jgi:hypothetical protein
MSVTKPKSLTSLAATTAPAPPSSSAPAAGATAAAAVASKKRPAPPPTPAPAVASAAVSTAGKAASAVVSGPSVVPTASAVLTENPAKKQKTTTSALSNGTRNDVDTKTASGASSSTGDHRGGVSTKDDKEFPAAGASGVLAVSRAAESTITFPVAPLTADMSDEMEKRMLEYVDLEHKLWVESERGDENYFTRFTVTDDNATSDLRWRILKKYNSEEREIVLCDCRPGKPDKKRAIIRTPIMLLGPYCDGPPFGNHVRFTAHPDKLKNPKQAQMMAKYYQKAVLSYQATSAMWNQHRADAKSPFEDREVVKFRAFHFRLVRNGAFVMKDLVGSKASQLWADVKREFRDLIEAKLQMDYRKTETEKQKVPDPDYKPPEADIEKGLFERFYADKVKVSNFCKSTEEKDGNKKVTRDGTAMYFKTHAVQRNFPYEEYVKRGTEGSYKWGKDKKNDDRFVRPESLKNPAWQQVALCLRDNYKLLKPGGNPDKKPVALISEKQPHLPFFINNIPYYKAGRIDKHTGTYEIIPWEQRFNSKDRSRDPVGKGSLVSFSYTLKPDHNSVDKGQFYFDADFTDLVWFMGGIEAQEPKPGTAASAADEFVPPPVEDSEGAGLLERLLMPPDAFTDAGNQGGGAAAGTAAAGSSGAVSGYLPAPTPTPTPKVSPASVTPAAVVYGTAPRPAPAAGAGGGGGGSTSATAVGSKTRVLPPAAAAAKPLSADADVTEDAPADPDPEEDSAADYTSTSVDGFD